MNELRRFLYLPMYNLITRGIDNTDIVLVFMVIFSIILCFYSFDISVIFLVSTVIIYYCHLYIKYSFMFE